ncbi:MAG: zinc ribbon domain-containing protein [Dehalococcoidia bacterium]|nr:MAG: zinc ribbon domain-containing protein [Dehalococcoidia bacterium]
MPLYEYYCEHCNGVFELIRPAREAARPQPCPECDNDAKRILSKEWAAFIYRDGLPRRLPDRGKYWHIFEEKDVPMTSSNVEVPEANPRYVKKDEAEAEAPEADELAIHAEVTGAADAPHTGGGFFKSRPRRTRPAR